MELHPHLAAAAAESARIARTAAAGLTDDRLAAPTPCAGMNTRDLLNHWVLYSAYGLEKRALREPLPDAWATRDFVAEPGWADAYAARLDRAVAAWADPRVWDGVVELGGGHSQSAAEIAGMLLLELTLHGWDAARATGREAAYPDDTAEAVLRLVEEYAEPYREYQGFAAPVAPPVGASAWNRALALSGRDPEWTP
ncbi:TIGR03086 family metal-binding protein [Yinghuangia sp. ASG 101]|uniref:TIGR03086 family metal-binding protein n=1 Tax=Yinghuangia sp. ASG 101 TaxID=2896848 RepID=UPI001E5C4F44|nr:TIGR03086 family metal-binding protein [Yinghuangia sp. ASG 101]UGQ09653.1 TIGR03086 family metal-binding protein [Yinghuangia sp. ASG 101]